MFHHSNIIIESILHILTSTPDVTARAICKTILMNSVFWKLCYIRDFTSL